MPTPQDQEISPSFEIAQNLPEQTIFDQFCSRLEHLTDSERDFIFELSDDFLRINSEKYVNIFFELLPQLSQKINTQSNIVFLSIKFKKDINKAKSGETLLYLLRSAERSIQAVLQDDPPSIKHVDFIAFTEGVSDLAIDDQESTYYCIVDDFSGTGHTALKSLKLVADLLQQTVSVDIKQQLGFSCLAAQEIAKEKVEQGGYGFFCPNVRKRGISDFHRKFGTIQTMQLLETKLGITNNYRGYNRSEALISLINTPNNTFPYFWQDGDTDDAPFSRSR